MVGWVVGWVGLGYVENKANSVQLLMQLPTGTELCKKLTRMTINVSNDTILISNSVIKAGNVGYLTEY